MMASQVGRFSITRMASADRVNAAHSCEKHGEDASARKRIQANRFRFECSPERFPTVHLLCSRRRETAALFSRWSPAGAVVFALV